MLKCAICFEPAVRPHVTVCGHLFCHDHIRKWLNSSSASSTTSTNSCPVCRRKINSGNKGGLIEVFDTGQKNRVAKEPEESEHGVGLTLDRLKDQWDAMLLERTKLYVQVRELQDQVRDLQSQLALHTFPATAVEEEAEEPTEFLSIRSDSWGEPAPISVELACSGSWSLDYEISVHGGPVHGIDVSSKLGIVASASWDRTCNLFDINRKVTVGQLRGVHEKGLYGVAFSKTAEHILATCSSDHTCNLWNVRTCSCLCSLEDHTDEVNGLSFHHSRNIIATASDDRTIILWDVAHGESISRLTGHRNSVYDVCFSPNSSLLASASFDWNTKLWDIRTKQEVRSLGGHTDDVIGVDISSTGHLVATGSDDGTCRVTDIRTWTTLAVLSEHVGEVKRIKFSPYTKALATTSADGTCKLWNTEVWKCFETLNCNSDGESDHCFDVCWQEDAEFLVTASHDCQWRYWIPEET